jgi:hypothetical protein
MKLAVTQGRLMAGVGSLLLLVANGLGGEAESRTTGVNLRHKIAQEAVDYSDLNAMAAAMGIDYPVLVERALDGKRGAMFLLLWMAGNASLDGAGAEGYSDTMVRVAREIGDKAIGEAARRLDRESLLPVRDAFLFEYGGDDGEEAAAEAVRRDFPTLWYVLAKAAGEQGGADQRGAAPESEGDGKAKREEGSR